jgi:hypothetical protein
VKVTGRKVTGLLNDRRTTCRMQRAVSFVLKVFAVFAVNVQPEDGEVPG